MNNLDEKISVYFTNKKEVIAVYLFGSYATGKNRRFSDVDIGIVVDESAMKNMVAFQEKVMIELPRILRADIHLVILNRSGEQLLRQVFLKGRCLLSNNKRKLAQFKMTAFSKIADFGYYKKQMQAGVLSRFGEGK